MPFEHALKTWPAAFQASWEGRKPYELRQDDRMPPFAVGDTLRLLEWDPSREEFSGRYILAEISYITRGRCGLPAGLAILALVRVYRGPTPPAATAA